MQPRARPKQSRHVPEDSIKTNIRNIDLEVRNKALDLLARREHATQEIRAKLIGRGLVPSIVDDILESLAAEGLLSDRRFAENYIRARKDRGYGPLRIRAELRQRGIDEDLISRYIDPHDRAWAESIEAVRHKRFGDRMPGDDIKERARQTRFLQYRGFTGEQISRLFKHAE